MARDAGPDEVARRNALVDFQPIDVVTNPRNIGLNDRFMAILPARKADLTGGIALHVGKGNVTAGAGAVAELFAGAAFSRGGRTDLRPSQPQPQGRVEHPRLDCRLPQPVHQPGIPRHGRHRVRHRLSHGPDDPGAGPGPDRHRAPRRPGSTRAKSQGCEAPLQGPDLLRRVRPPLPGESCPHGDLQGTVENSFPAHQALRRGRDAKALLPLFRPGRLLPVLQPHQDHAAREDAGIRQRGLPPGHVDCGHCSRKGNGSHHRRGDATSALRTVRTPTRRFSSTRPTRAGGSRPFC